MDNKEKKKFLKRCQRSLIIIRSINEEIKTLRANAIMHSQNMDGMPHGSNQNDLSTFAAKLDEIFTELNNEIENYWNMRCEIISAIESLPSESEKAILRLRYINGDKWEDIADKLTYSLQHVYKIHGTALIHLKTEKEESKCD